jgi:hypothetical protein
MKQLSSTQQIPEKSLLRAYRKGFGYSKLEVVINSRFFLGALANEDFFSNVADGDSLETYLWVENVASYNFTLTVIGKLSRGANIIFFEHTDRIERSEKRKCLKAKVDLPVKFFLFSSRRIVKSFTSEEIIYHKGNIMEMSDREIILQSGEELPPENFLYGHIPVNGENIEIIGKYESLGGGAYLIPLTGISEKDRMRLLDYIFSIYRE